MDFAESSRRAATRVEAHLRHHKAKVLLVCSVEENEGKSTVAANLAIAIAEHGEKVLLVDGDLRKPGQYKIFDRKGEKRLSFSDVLTGKASLEEVLSRNSKAGFWELFQYESVAQAGNLLAGAKLRQLMEELKDQADVIVIDSPPVAAAADAEIWMHLADSVALVVRQDASDVRVINDTVDLIWKSAGDFAGFLLNAFPRLDRRPAGHN